MRIQLEITQSCRNFTLIRFEMTEPLAFLKSIPQQEKKQEEQDE